MQENNISAKATDAKDPASRPSELNKKIDISKKNLYGSSKKHEQIESPRSANQPEEDIDAQTERRLLGSY